MGKEKLKRKPVKVSAASKHKDSLSKLQKTDPEFYEFLQKEDTSLLAFQDEDSDNGSDGFSEGSEESADEAEETDSNGPMSGDDVESDDELGTDEDESSSEEVGSEEVVSNDEELGSDEQSDAETEDNVNNEDDDDEEEEDTSMPHVTKTIVTVSMVEGWTKSMKGTPSPRVLHQLVMAFRASVQSVGSDQSKTATTNYRVQGTEVFNAVVRSCIATLYPGLQKMLSLNPSNKDALPSSSPRWSKVRTDIKSYITELMQLQKLLSSSSTLDAVLKHILVMVPCYACFPKLSRVLLKQAIGVWSTGENSSRVVAFLVINKLVTLQQDMLLQTAIKQMYMAYISNCKFTSPTSLPAILFLQRSLAEMLSIDLHVSYQYAFVYIRQLAIHLRNAITVKKEENVRAVYNWQFVHSCGLWTELLCNLHPNPVLEPLIYPLTQVIIGTIRLQGTARYIPLRFHCTKLLNKLCRSTHTFIPVLPLIMEILDFVNFNKKHQAVSFKPYNFACILKFSKAQLQSRAFKDGVMEHVVENLLDHLNVYSHSIGFPELVLPAQIQLKKFVKQCKVQNYSKQVKQVLTKVEETCKTILSRRRSASLNLADHTAVDAWDKRSRETGTPLSKFYTGWRKQRDVQLQQIMSAGVNEKDEGSSDESKSIKEKKNKKRNRDESDDEDFTAEELAQLNRSASDDDDDDDESYEDEDDNSDDDDGYNDSKKDNEVEVKRKNNKRSMPSKNVKPSSPKKLKKEAAGKKPVRVDHAVDDSSDIVKDFSFSSDED